MKIGMVTDSLGHLSLDDMLDTAARLGIKGVEFNAANWTSAPHMNLKALLDSPAGQRDLLKSVKSHGLDIIALNANVLFDRYRSNDRRMEA
jgi:sugar phosphate isomerase/epimerase